VLADQRAAEEWTITAMARRLEDRVPVGNGAPISDRPASAA
jgi:hypothetical protein